MNIDVLADGIRQANEEYIARPEMDLEAYPVLILAYLLQSALNEIDGEFDFGLYGQPEEIGWRGWFTVGDQTLFFAPTQVAILENTKGGSYDDEPPPFV